MGNLQNLASRLGEQGEILLSLQEPYERMEGGGEMWKSDLAARAWPNTVCTI
jgi:hypothetical protein